MSQYMDRETKNQNHSSLAFIGPILLGVLINVLGSELAEWMGLPFYLDTIGTVLIAWLGGYLPGILVAIISNTIGGIGETYTVYYGIINVLIAVSSAFFVKKNLRRAHVMVIYLFVLAFLGGGLGSILTWTLEGFAINETSSRVILFFYRQLGMNQLLAHFWGELVTNFFDKALTVLLAAGLARLLPEGFRRSCHIYGWRQAPLSEESQKEAEQLPCRTGSLSTKVVWILTIAALMLVLIATDISMVLFQEYTMNQHEELAKGVAALAASVINPDKVELYLEQGEDAEGYRETERLLYQIRECAPDVEYLYAYKIMEDGGHVIFDLDTEELEGDHPGDIEVFSEEFDPYYPTLLAGGEIEPVVSNDIYGLLLTAFKPVYNRNGECVCYAAADVAVKNLSNYVVIFTVKLVSLFSSFFLLILAVGLWLARYRIVLPINSMSACASAFAYENEVAQEENVEKIRRLEIHTGDEIENLYLAFLKTTEDSMFYVEDIRKKTDLLSDMQRGLIMLLADMVENRDQSTGAHVRKTAAYTGIIMRHLRKLGYYKNMLTDQYLSDVEQSAPLHDVGKIQIPDAILNKPGKLTDEEFEIMKTHTTAGEKILAEAIESVPGAEYLKEAKNLAAYHHEKWNGTGYPRGLAGEQIPLSARIMAVADVFDALVSKRCYKEPFSFEKAMDIIKEDAGSHFDPKIVEAFVDAEDEVRQVAQSFQNMEVQ